MWLWEVAKITQIFCSRIWDEARPHLLFTFKLHLISENKQSFFCRNLLKNPWKFVKLRFLLILFLVSNSSLNPLYPARPVISRSKPVIVSLFQAIVFLLLGFSLPRTLSLQRVFIERKFCGWGRIIILLKLALVMFCQGTSGPGKSYSLLMCTVLYTTGAYDLETSTRVEF